MRRMGRTPTLSPGVKPKTRKEAEAIPKAVFTPVAVMSRMVPNAFPKRFSDPPGSLMERCTPSREAVMPPTQATQTTA